MKSIFKGCCWLISLFEGLELLCTGPTDLSVSSQRSTLVSLLFRDKRLYGVLVLAFLRPSRLGLPTAFWSWPPYGLLVLAFLRPSGLGLPTAFRSWPSYGLLVLAFLRPSGLGLLTTFLPLAFLRPLCLQAFVPSGLCAYFLVLALLRPSGLGLTTAFCCFMGGATEWGVSALDTPIFPSTV